VRRGRSLERLLYLVSTGCFVVGLAFLAWPVARIALTGYATGEIQAEALAAWDRQPSGYHSKRDGVLLLEIPRLGLRRVVPDGATVAHLRQYGVAHISWTAFPPVGKEFAAPRPAHATEPPRLAMIAAGPAAAPQVPGGVVAIAGHRTTYGAPFFRVGKLHPGDGIVLLYDGWRYTYRVTRQVTVRPSDVGVLDDSGPEIALISCSPPFSAAYRLIVFGQLDTVTALQRSEWRGR